MARAVMVQGTMSNVGKSLIAAGLCRIFWQDGFRVAPFKAQNMALNSFITADGGEMGRAQVVQAACAGKAPDVRMNPILLKPTTDQGSQVIVNGKPQGNLCARDYFRKKPSLIPTVREAYASLAAENDIVVIEGAGSPAELNLRYADCFVNMGMAEIADAPVLLVGDIDRGGVFAQLIGTVDLLTPKERARVRGLIVNKFRGDGSLFADGVRILEEKTGIPVVGVTPYLHLDIDEEDSLSEKLKKHSLAAQNAESDRVVHAGRPLRLAVVRLPRISNYTDFDPLSRVPGVRLTYVTEAAQLDRADAILLPGTKNTIGDLAWLRRMGLDRAILRQAAAGKVVLGICGGYQMLGASLGDPCDTEGSAAAGEVPGLGLLPVRTVFGREKRTAQVTGHFCPVAGPLSPLSGKHFGGYEIHMGVTAPLPDRQRRTLTEVHRSAQASAETNAPCAAAGQNRAIGAAERLAGAGRERNRHVCADGAQAGNVYGTYVHGIFDAAEVTEAFLAAVFAERRRAEQAEDTAADTAVYRAMDAAAYAETQYDALAAALRKSLDMTEIYSMLGLNGPCV